MKKKNLLTVFSLAFFSVASFASEKSLYDFKWLDEGEKVYVVQNKEYMKTGNLALDMSFIQSDSSPYQDTIGFSGALTYYFNENYSIDFTYKSYNNENSADVNNLLNATANEIKPLITKVDAAKLIHLNWIPFYGKINTFNKIFFFDWGVGLGIGQFDTQSNHETFDDKDVPLTYTKSSDLGFNIRSYFKFFTRNNYTFGFEYNLSGVNTIKTPEGKEELHWYTDIMATLGYMF